MLIAAVWLALCVPLSTVSQAQDDRGDRGRGGWRREGGPGRPRPDGERRGNREERGERREEREAAAATTTSSPGSTANSFGAASDADRMRKWASDTVAKHDANDDKILEGDELSKLGQSSRSADSNGDGKITVDELYQFSSKGSSSTSAAKPATTTTTKASSSRPAPADPKERTITNDKRKSYRFKSTKDRINNWRYSSRDANGDGQVSMSEYARTWNERTAAEFMRHDKNNDGMISPDEAP